MTLFRIVALLVLSGCGSSLGPAWKTAEEPWSLKTPEMSPSPRMWSAMAFDANRNRTVLFGGMSESNEQLDDTWEWDGLHWQLIEVAEDQRPSARFLHSMAFDPIAKKIVLFGGVDRTDLWEWNGFGWAERKSEGPPGTGLFAFDVAHQSLVVIAPDQQSGNWLTSSWQKGEWRFTDVGPRTTGGAIAVDLERNNMVVFGGRVGSSIDNETWEKFGEWESREGDAPAARTSHSMTYDIARRRTVVFGGRGEDEHALNDTWEWDGSTWKEAPVAGPQARDAQAMAYDSNRGRVVIFGGRSQHGLALSDTWER